MLLLPDGKRGFMMQRRGFLGVMLAAGVAPAFVGSKILMPVKAIALPYDASESVYALNMQKSMEAMTREMLAVLNGCLRFSGNIEREYVEPWEAGRTVVVRRPRQLLARM